jgi:hypothetical protein
MSSLYHTHFIVPFGTCKCSFTFTFLHLIFPLKEKYSAFFGHIPAILHHDAAAPTV